jgi:hypothetical protein
MCNEFRKSSSAERRRIDSAKRHLDSGSIIVAVITLILFLAALVTKGITHDLFLESAVFLVSIKIILMAYRNSVAIGNLNEKLDAIVKAIQDHVDHNGKSSGSSRDQSNQER